VFFVVVVLRLLPCVWTRSASTPLHGVTPARVGCASKLVRRDSFFYSISVLIVDVHLNCFNGFIATIVTLQRCNIGNIY
jgi:hypothetical protein